MAPKGSTKQRRLLLRSYRRLGRDEIIKILHHYEQLPKYVHRYACYTCDHLLPKLHFAAKQYSGELDKSGTQYYKRKCLNCDLNSRTFPPECILNMQLRNESLCKRCNDVRDMLCRKCGGCVECVQPVMEMRGPRPSETTLVCMKCYSEEQGWVKPSVMEESSREMVEVVNDSVILEVEEGYEDLFNPELFADEDGDGSRDQD